MRVGSLVSYVGHWIPGIFPDDRTREPSYGIIIEIDHWSQGTNVCVYWTEAEETYWHEETEMLLLNE